MKRINTGLFLRHPVGQWRRFCGWSSRALGGELVITHVWQRKACAVADLNRCSDATLCKDKRRDTPPM
jgi:hypothetical protein